jgi:methionyl-tRNA formyltransferase
MNIVFAGTPEFAVPALKALLDAGHRVLAVYTQPDRPAGRGRRLSTSPVKEFALAHELPVRQPTTLRTDAEAEALRSLAPDAMIVIAYGLILPRSILTIPRLGCINVHASLLPRWRGAAPIQRAIEAGDARTGVTIMQMAEGLDTGPILASHETPIEAHDTAATLHDRLGALGASLLAETLAKLEHGAVSPQPQDNTCATYAAKLKKDEAHLDWTADARLVARRVRAFNPWPVAQTMLNGQILRLWEASAEDSPETATDTPGTVLSADTNGIRVRCGHGALRITRLQIEGGRALDAAAFLNGRPLPAGTQLGT